MTGTERAFLRITSGHKQHKKQIGGSPTSTNEMKVRIRNDSLSYFRIELIHSHCQAILRKNEANAKKEKLVVMLQCEHDGFLPSVHLTPVHLMTSLSLNARRSCTSSCPSSDMKFLGRPEFGFVVSTSSPSPTLLPHYHNQCPSKARCPRCWAQPQQAATRGH